MRCAVVLGTRPDIVKMAPVIRALQRRAVPMTLLHTGQHYDAVLDRDLFEELSLPPPDRNLRVGSASHGQQSARILAGAEVAFTEVPTGMVLVQGDTNSAMAAAMAAAKLKLPIGHVEAGLRSYDRGMPEEVNRVVVDHIATHLYAPTQRARANLVAEGISADRVLVTGNTIADVVLGLLRDEALEHPRLAHLGVVPSQYAVVTAHRAENVDRAEPLGRLLGSVAAVARTYGLTVLFPCHPRTRARLQAFGLTVPPAVRLLEPLGLRDFLALQRYARVVLTDSGGVQEESCILGVPCVTLRTTTERPETVEVGANVVAGLEEGRVLAAVDALLSAPHDWEQPFGAGTAGEQVAASIVQTLG